MNLDSTPATEDATAAATRPVTVRTPDKPRASASVLPPMRRAELEVSAQGASAPERRAVRRARPSTPPARLVAPIILEMDGVRVSLEPQRLTIDFTTER
jgi:hypothetical protein